MSNLQIDINCDMGESFGNFKIGNDEAIFPYITSCNIACGFHGGDPLQMEKTINLALKHGVQIGAHPSYPDLAGFGRRKMQLKKQELKALLKYQIAALKGMAESLGGQVAYVKPHGALYNTAADNETETLAIIQAIQEMGSNIALMGLAGSTMETVAKKEQIPFVAEAFADRRYTPQGRLMSRSLEGSVIHNPKAAADQVISLVLKNKVQSNKKIPVTVKAQSICIHGDNPQVVEILEAIHQGLIKNGVTKKAFAAI